MGKKSKIETVSSGMVSARERIKSIDQLAAVARAAREEGKTVVLAHGVFDLVHMGHARHLEAAKKLGDILIVTVTADEYINKGPGRPVFPELLRAEMLGALAYVDWCGVNHGPTAENILEEIKPDIYVKGGDYADAEKDVTGKIVAEQELVESNGGRIVFTDEITFSSSELINAHMAMHEPETRAFIDEIRREGDAPGVISLIDSIANYRVLLIGETIIDEYHYVTPVGTAAKENIIATRYQSRELFAGGVIAAANHVAGFCGEGEVVTCLGDNQAHEEVVRKYLLPNVNLNVFRQEDRPTICKRRYVDDSDMSKLFEVGYMDDRPISQELSQNICDYLAAHAGDFDLVIVCDFGHGLMTRPIIEEVVRRARFLAVNAQSNSTNRGYNSITKYPRADMICIDEPEARLAVCDKHSDLQQIVGEELPAAIDCEKFIVTYGNRGCLVWDRGTGVQHIPAFTHTPVDTIGAGDAFLSIASPLVAAGGAMRDVGFVGNIVGGIKVGIVGHRKSVDKTSVKKSIIGLLK